MGLVESQARIDDRVHDGGSLDQVENEIIEPAPFAEEQKAALWLYASATIPRHLAEVTAATAQQSRSRISGVNAALRSAGRRTVAKARARAGDAGARTTMAEREPVNLQREADAERPWTTKSKEGSERLERFKQGEVDRWGGDVDVNTPPGDFYVERPPRSSQP
jgi:hypothetical protein